jgi:hypothetical protein
LKLERIWAVIGVYWTLVFLATEFFPYELAYVLMTLGYLLSIGLAFFSVMVLGYRKIQPRMGVFKKWWSEDIEK